MKLLNLLVFAVALGQIVNAATLTEFDSEDYQLGAPTVKTKSVEIWIDPKAKKISEGVYYQEKGGCSGCTFITAAVKYEIEIPLTKSLTILLPRTGYVWSATTSYNGGQTVNIPDYILKNDLNGSEIAEATGRSAQPMLNFIANVRRKNPIFDPKESKCYRSTFRGTYMSSNRTVTSFESDKYLVACP